MNEVIEVTTALWGIYIHQPASLPLPQWEPRCQLTPLASVVFGSTMITKGKVRIHTVCFQRQHQKQLLPFIEHLLFTRASSRIISFNSLPQESYEVDVLIRLIFIEL